MRAGSPRARISDGRGSSNAESRAFSGPDGARTADRVQDVVMFLRLALPLATVVTALSTPALATDIYATGFNDYGTGSLSGQLAWIGTGGTWAVSGSVNSPFLPGTVIGAGTDAGVDPFGGRGRMVRLVTEKFSGGRTKAWLDLLNSGKWATASAGGSTVLETRVKVFVPAGQQLASGFGVMISKSAIDISGGFLVNADGRDLAAQRRLRGSQPRRDRRVRAARRLEQLRLPLEQRKRRR